ncbi:hypothetical protein FNV43_RR10227 [Rhamnella rubrinervis]|uniref:Myb-like domain-containing protein n=1 Tax=Rhamnella rubrinervis TaxID=2594499 RepID=A0A8K0HC82_9ROSA|nr:hypothetical protein FNV43_RR10227 [Rhamnella rubrinervis]
MEFLDEDARPRFVLQSRAPNSSIADSQTDQSNLSKPFLFLTISVSLLLLGSSLFFIQSEPFKSLLLWVALSVLIGPFAPASLTGGDVRVGQGPIVELSPPDTAQAEEETKRVSQKRSKPRRFEDPVVDSTPLVDPNIVGSLREEKKKEVCEGDSHGVASLGEEKEWVEEDTEILKKQLLKHPVGKPRRWEVIAEAFGGRFKVETVIKKAKESGEKKLGDADSYAQFLKKRKPVDKRIEDENEESNGGLMMAENGGVSWSSAEDIALLNALKAFPKDVSMRWEKIAASVPGKPKAACMKRVAELKKDFRSAKASSQA